MTGYVGPWRLWEGTPGDPAIKNAWGTSLNSNTTLLMAGAVGSVSVDLTGVTTFSLSANNGTADQSRPLIQSYTGAPTGNCTVTIPNAQKVGYAQNSTSGSHNVILTSGGGATVTIPPNGFWYFFSCDGSGNVTLPGIGLGEVAASDLSGGPFAGFRNVIINGNFRINQRGYVSGTATAQFVYMHDRWQAGSGGGTYTFTQTQPDTTITITAGTIRQIVEGANLPGGTMTLSWAGTAQAQINAGGFKSSPITIGSLSAGSNVTLEFNAGTLGKVQFEFGSTATSFERRPITTEQMLCYRYFWVLPTALTLSGFTDTGFGVSVTQTVLFPVPMRGVPAVSSVFSAGSGNASESVSNVSAGGFGVFLSAIGVRGGFTVTYNGGNTASAEL